MSDILRFALHRFIVTICMLFALTFIVYGLMELVPANCAERYVAYKATQGQILTQADVRAEEIRMGLDKPFVERWIHWVKGIVLEGDLGQSCLWRVDVTALIGDKFLLSMVLAYTALMLTYIIALPVGILSANLRGGFVDGGIRFISYLGLALPNFFVALAIMVISTVYFGDTLTGLFSAEYEDAPWSWAKGVDMLSRVWLPVTVLAWSATALQLQTIRALMLDENDKLYVTAARARGIVGFSLMMRYPARHALTPVVNSIGYDLNRIFSDLPIIATVLIISDAGNLLLESLAVSNDQTVAGAIILMKTTAIVVMNFVTDVVLAIFDPRIRKSFLR